MSAVKLTPSSTAESGPTSGVAGAAVLGQMVRWVCARELIEQPKTTANAKSVPLKYLNVSSLDARPGISAAKHNVLRCGVHKNKHSSLRSRTTTPPDVLCGFQLAGSLDWV